jgi:hypothetical protein
MADEVTAQDTGGDAGQQAPADSRYDFSDVDDGIQENVHDEVLPADENSGGETGAKDSAEGDTGKPSKPDSGSGFDAALVKRAREAGMSDDEARSFGSPDALKRALDWGDRRRGQSSEQGQSQEREQKPTAPQQQRKPRINLEQFELDPAFDPSLHAMAKNLKGMAEQINSAFDELESHTLGVVNHFQEQQREAFYDRFDSMIEELGEDYAPIFGKGRRADVLNDAKAVAARAELINQMLVDAESHARINPDKPIPSERELLQRAVRALHGDKQQTIARREVAKNLRDRKTGQFVSRPAQRQSAESKGTPEQRANAYVNRFFAERGHDQDDGEI